MWPWLAFGALVAVLLALDLMFFHRRAARRSLRASAAWSALFIGTGLAVATAASLAFPAGGRRSA